MVELEPERFLDRPQRAIEAQVAAADALLREALAGADVEAMLIEDPALLFEELQSLETGTPARRRFRCRAYMYCRVATLLAMSRLNSTRWSPSQDMPLSCRACQHARAVGCRRASSAG